MIVSGRGILGVVILALWILGTARGAVSPAVLPGPIPVLREGALVVISGPFWLALIHTFSSWILGLLIAFVGGTAIGLAIGSSRLAVMLSRSLIDFVRCVPPVTIVPLALLLYGTSIKMKLLLIIYGAVWEVIVQAIYAAREVDPVADATMRAYSIGGWRRVRSLLVPSATPFMVTGFRIAAVSAFLITLASEVIGGAPGIGGELENSYQSGNIIDMWVYIFVAAIIGIGLNILLEKLQHRILRGHPGYREEG